MHFSSSLFLLASAAQVMATPVASEAQAIKVARGPSDESSLQNLGTDDVIVLSTDGNATVMKVSEYDALQRRAEVLNAETVRRALAADQNTRKARKTKRCETSTEVQVLTDTTFLNWDVAMSPVMSASGGSASISISDGYSISNSLSVGASSTLTLVEDILQVSYTITYDETWTSSTTASYTFTVPDGQYGVIVSEPSVRRLTGYTLDGCSDSWTKTEFTSDSYTSTTYGGLTWPAGVIRLCNSTTYPIPYCIGTGTHS